jgi:hypothetical protein
VVSLFSLPIHAKKEAETPKHSANFARTFGLIRRLSLRMSERDVTATPARRANSAWVNQSQRRFIGLMRVACKPRLGIRARYYLDITDDDEFDAVIARLVAQARQSPEMDQS